MNEPNQEYWDMCQTYYHEVSDDDEFDYEVAFMQRLLES